MHSLKHVLSADSQCRVLRTAIRTYFERKYEIKSNINHLISRESQFDKFFNAENEHRMRYLTLKQERVEIRKRVSAVESVLETLGSSIAMKKESPLYGYLQEYAIECAEQEKVMKRLTEREQTMQH